MGMRVKKMVGWGTNDFIVEDEDAFDEKREALWGLSSLDWLEWLLEHQDQISELTTEHGLASTGCIRLIEVWSKSREGVRLTPPGQCYGYDDEFGVDNTIVFWPFHMGHKCYRNDDLIDWFEEQNHCEPRFVPVARGIYPYVKGDVPEPVIGTCLFLGIESVIPKLTESLYVYWA